MAVCNHCGQKITTGAVPVAWPPSRRRISFTQGSRAEPDYTTEERAYMDAVDAWRTRNRRIPSCTEQLEILKSLGYRKHDAP